MKKEWHESVWFVVLLVALALLFVYIAAVNSHLPSAIVAVGLGINIGLWFDNWQFNRRYEKRMRDFWEDKL